MAEDRKILKAMLAEYYRELSQYNRLLNRQDAFWETAAARFLNQFPLSDNGKKQYFYFLAENGKNVDAFLIIFLKKKFIAPEILFAFVEAAFTRKNERRKDVMSGLFLYSKQYLSDKNIQHWELNILSQNRHARLFWQKLGFHTLSETMIESNAK